MGMPTRSASCFCACRAWWHHRRLLCPVGTHTTSPPPGTHQALPPALQLLDGRQGARDFKYQAMTVDLKPMQLKNYVLVDCPGKDKFMGHTVVAANMVGGVRSLPGSPVSSSSVSLKGCALCALHA